MSEEPAVPETAPPVQQESELERTLGLTQALAIGTGTMIGAGIFVFPGLAAGEAGPAAMLSFALGAVIAILVALPTSELATAMPESGGGYYFVSRGLGSLLGCMVGLGQWLGLIFASAFYLVGFGYYLTDLCREIGLSVPVPVVGLALGTAILLTGVSLTGTENTGDLQNWIVGSLLVILGGFLGHGGLDVLGVFGRERVPETFFPYGTLPVFTTAALDAVAKQFRAGGADVTTRLVFTGNKFDTLMRISTEEDCDAVLIPGPMRPLRKVLVPLRGPHNAARIAPFVADLIQDSSAVQDGTTDVTLLHILEPDETNAAARDTVLQPTADLMTSHGIDAGLLCLETTASDDPADTIVDTSKEHDLVVLGETKPSVRDILFGTVPERVVKTAQVPVVLVRHEEEDVDMAERAMQTGRS